MEADALPGPLAVGAGTYLISEQLPDAVGGEWRAVAVTCNSRPLSRRGRGETRVVVTAATGVACRFTNAFIPDGSITITKTARGGSGSTGFVISYQGAPARQYAQSADVAQDETVTATGDSTARLPLGRYVIQETATLTDENRPWVLTSVSCDGQLIPFEQKRVTIELTAEHPDDSRATSRTSRPRSCPGNALRNPRPRRRPRRCPSQLLRRRLSRRSRVRRRTSS